jgi:ribokinase
LALAIAGVDVTGLVADPDAATGIALILVDDAGENVISVASGANLAIGSDAIQRELGRLGSLAGDVVLVSNELVPAAAATALTGGSAGGARTIFNPAPAAGVDPAWFESVDLLTPNRGELWRLAGVEPGSDVVAAARGLAVREAVIVTLGSEGALVVPNEGEPWSAPAIPVDVIDTTGAGDAFNGALAASLAEGRALDVAVRRAVAAGGLATTRVGAREGMPTAAELAAVAG